MSESKPLFQVASRGVAWSMLASVLVMTASLLAQLVLGLLLDETEYGVYALAFASSDFLTVFRDGGVQLWLSRLTPRRFRRVEGQAFWLATACSIATSVALIALAFVVASPAVFNDPTIKTYLFVLAAGFPLTAYSSVALAKLQVDLQFRTMATIKLVSALTRHSLVVLFAYLGWGPLSFALAFFGITLLELVLYFAATKIRPWLTRPRIAWSAWMFRSSRWSLGGAFATAVLRQSDYVVLGLIAPKEIVGFYFFGYQIAMQPVLLFSESLRRVVLPIFSRRFNGAEDQSRSLRYLGVFLGSVATLGMLGLVVTMKPLEALLWHGRWTESVRPIQYLALAMPLHLASFVAEMLAQSQGRFRLWTTSVLVRGLGFGVAAMAAGWLGGASDPAIVAAVVAIYIALSAIVEIVMLLTAMEASSLPLFHAMLPPYLLGLALAVPLVYVELSFGISPLVEFLIRGSCFVIGLAVLWALFSRGTYRDLRAMFARFVGSQRLSVPESAESAE